MDYATAKTIIAEIAPDLLLDPEVPGQAHILVRKTKDGPPFSIMLPRFPAQKPIEEQERDSLAESISAAKEHLDAQPE